MFVFPPDIFSAQLSVQNNALNFHLFIFSATMIH